MIWFLPRSDPGAATEYLRPNGCGVSTEGATLLPPRHAADIAMASRVSTAFAESTVNAVVGKRFAKRQQMS